MKEISDVGDYLSGEGLEEGILCPMCEQRHVAKETVGGELLYLGF